MKLCSVLYFSNFSAAKKTHLCLVNRDVFYFLEQVYIDTPHFVVVHLLYLLYEKYSKKSTLFLFFNRVVCVYFKFRFLFLIISVLYLILQHIQLVFYYFLLLYDMVLLLLLDYYDLPCLQLYMLLDSLFFLQFFYNS